MKMSALVAIVASLLFLAGPAPNVRAVSTNACHCFKERAYNPVDRFAADDYILATSFNSLLAKAYDIPKKQIVFLKMKGGAGHFDLLVGLEVSKTSGTELGQLLSIRKEQSWREILARSGIAEKILPDDLLSAVAAGKSPEKIGPRLADRLLIRFFGVDPAEVTRLREAGLQEKEMALVFILARTGEKEPADLADRYVKEGKSWSQIAHELGIGPAQAGKLILAFGG